MKPYAFLLLQRWLRTLCEGTPDEVVALYCPDAVLVPTFANIRIGSDEIRDYFLEFMSRPGLCGRIDEWVEQSLGNIALVSGVYTFGWYGDEGGPTTAQARFTLVAERRAGRWKIINHHSSAVPEEARVLH